MRSDVEDLMPRLLPIETENSSEALKLNGAPRNPQEYLRQVQLEAALCPEVVVAQIDPMKLRKPQTVNASISGCQAAPEGFSPSLGWQRQQVANFSDVRQSISKHRRHWSTQTLDENVVMPKLSDEEGWKMFCLGARVYKATTWSETDPDSNIELDYSTMGFPPFLSIVSRLNQTTVLALLEILGGWFEEAELVPQLGRWLYALLACLEKPLIPEAHSLIRQLARRCGNLRSTLQRQEDKRLPPLNLLICLVARYFEQSDLADQQE